MKWLFLIMCIVTASVLASEEDTRVVVRNDTQCLINFDTRYTFESRHSFVAHYLGPQESVQLPLRYKNSKNVKFVLDTLTLMPSRYERHHADVRLSYIFLSQKKALFFIIRTDKVTDDLVLVPALTRHGQKLFEKVALTSQQWIDGLGIKHQKLPEQIKKHQEAVKKEMEVSLPQIPKPLSKIISEYEGPELEYEF